MGNVYVRSGHVRNILTDATSTVNGSWQFKDAPKTAIQATVSGTGAVSATVVIEASNDALFAVSTAIGTITLSGTTSSTDGFTTDAPWKYIRANVTAISGTSATVNVIVSS
jgi:hypothetical protein